MSNGTYVRGVYSTSTNVYTARAIFYPNGSNGTPDKTSSPVPTAAPKVSPTFVIDVTNL